MGKITSKSFDSFKIISPIFLILYLSIGFIPNLQAVDKIAPQWLLMSFLNFFSVIYFLIKRQNLNNSIDLNLKSTLTLTYIVFFIWAIGSLFYAINPTEAAVNLARQFNVFIMFFSMSLFIVNYNNKKTFLSWLISIYLLIEVFAVLLEANEMFKSNGLINGSLLKGVTANRNITAFSIALKIPFALYLVYITKKKWVKLFVPTLITLSLICLSMIQSRASFIAIGFIILFYFILQFILYINEKKNLKKLLNLGFILIPLIITIGINKVFLASKGADALLRASTISVNTNDSSINQRLRYYEDVLSHVISNPIIGVGLGNWKLKSIDYDKDNIEGYVVPYHAHSDFIQIGAELGIIGFVLYIGIFILAVIFAYKLIKSSEVEIDEKVFIFLIITVLGIYSIDANLNFPIARPQVLIVWTLIIALISSYYQKLKFKNSNTKPYKTLNYSFLVISLIFLLPSIYINNSVYKSLKGQMFLLQDFNSNQYNVTLNQINNIVPDIPNITVTTIPINTIKARYFVNAKQYDKALSLIEKGVSANPYLFYSEILKSQIFQEKGQLDSAKIYARKAFFGLPNNDLHATTYLNLINITRDLEALEESFEVLTKKNKLVNWKNYLIIANSLNKEKNTVLIERARKAIEIFPNNDEFKNLYNQITIGIDKLNESINFSKTGLDYFNKGDYSNAAFEFEKAIKANPLDYAHYENAATSNYLNGNLGKALEQIDVVISEMNPLNGKCEYIKALIFIRMGDPIGACPLLETARDSGFAQAEGTIAQYCQF